MGKQPRPKLKSCLKQPLTTNREGLCHNCREDPRVVKEFRSVAQGKRSRDSEYLDPEVAASLYAMGGFYGDGNPQGVDVRPSQLWSMLHLAPVSHEDRLTAHHRFPSYDGPPQAREVKRTKPVVHDNKHRQYRWSREATVEVIHPKPLSRKPVDWGAPSHKGSTPRAPKPVHREREQSYGFGEHPEYNSHIGTLHVSNRVNTPLLDRQMYLECAFDEAEHNFERLPQIPQLDPVSPLFSASRGPSLRRQKHREDLRHSMERRRISHLPQIRRMNSTVGRDIDETIEMWERTYDRYL
jgi:hypothetical protein